MAMVDVGESSLEADLQPRSVGVVWRSAAARQRGYVHSPDELSVQRPWISHECPHYSAIEIVVVIIIIIIHVNYLITSYSQRVSMATKHT